jgi:hypothetical protein|tara:strand:- start:9850 stop:10029 length:180 start_codon:yes stop_codon:yes gene_type:complete
LAQHPLLDNQQILHGNSAIGCARRVDITVPPLQFAGGDLIEYDTLCQQDISGCFFVARR